RQKRDFMVGMRKNLLHRQSNYPFVYLDPALGDVGEWWRGKLKELLEHFKDETLARSLLNVAYFPYPSRRFGHRGLFLPSQAYSFGLVQDALKRGAVIVFMRRDDMWKQAVPDLKTYDRLFHVKNVRNPAISRKNCPGGFQKIIEAIGAAEAK